MAEVLVTDEVCSDFFQGWINVALWPECKEEQGKT